MTQEAHPNEVIDAVNAMIENQTILATALVGEVNPLTNERSGGLVDDVKYLKAKAENGGFASKIKWSDAIGKIVAPGGALLFLLERLFS